MRLIGIVLSLASVVSPAVAAQESADEYINRGMAQHERGELDEAIASYRKAIELYPQPDGASVTLSFLSFNLAASLAEGRFQQEALAAYLTAIELQPGPAQPDLAAAHNKLGRALLDKGESGEAIASFLIAMGFQPDLAEAYNNLGVALQDRKQWDGAIALFRKAVELRPDFAEAQSNLEAAPSLREAAELQGEARFLAEDITSFRKAVELDPDSSRAHRELAQALLATGEQDEAIASFRKIIELDPDSSRAHRELAQALLNTGEQDEAIASFRKVLELADSTVASLGAHYDLGSALKEKGELDEAIASFRKVLELLHRVGASMTDFMRLHHDIGLALKEKGDLDEAIASFRRELELAYLPTTEELEKVWRKYGMTERNWRKARTDLAMRAHYQLGLALQEAGQEEEAQRHLDEARRLGYKPPK